MNWFYCYICARGATFGIFFSLWILFFKDIGLNLFEIGIMGAVLEISRMIFEMPTGSFADRYGRKKSLLGASIMYGIALGMLSWAPNIIYVYIAIFVFGIGDSFHSGAFEAWLMDYLLKKNCSSLFKSKITNAYIGLYIFCMITSVGAGPLYQISPYMIIYCAVGFNLVSLLSCIFMEEVIPLKESMSKEKSRNFAHHLFSTIKNVVRLTRSQGSLGSFFIAGLFLALSFDGIERYYQPYLQYIHIDPIKISLVYSISSLFGILLLIFDKCINRLFKINDVYALVVYQILIMFFVFLVVVFSTVVSYVGIIILFALLRLLGPSEQNFLNMRIPSEFRATALSAYEFTGACGEIIAGFLIGFIAHSFGLKDALAASAAILIIPIIILSYIIRLQSKKAYDTCSFNRTYE